MTSKIGTYMNPNLRAEFQNPVSNKKQNESSRCKLIR